ncbi:MAG TPA: STAS domain-containing protein [Terriglobia bacterium]|nr:STAS domain-containing protein [Terriglobia bacterium]
MNSHADRFSGIDAPQSCFAPTCTISERQSGDVSMVAVYGPLTAQRAVREFGNRVRELLDHGVRKIAVDLRGVAEIDSCGLGALAAAYNRTAAAGGTIGIFAPQPRVRRLLERLCLDSVLGVFDDEEQALGAFRSADPQNADGKYTVSWRWM